MASTTSTKHEPEKRDGRGGARAGAGRPYSRLHLDSEAAKLLTEHMRQVNEPGLSAEEAVKRLLRTSRAQRETAYTDIMQVVQTALQQRWQAITGTLLSNVGLQLEELSSHIVNQIQAEVQKNPVYTPPQKPNLLGNE